MDSESHRIRIRGIYATALTHRFQAAGWEIVAASAPIQRRFDTQFSSGAHDVAIEMTADRQGVAIHGDSEAVAAATAELSALARDTFCWGDPTPPGAVFESTVSATRRSGAIVELGDTEGYLPFHNADSHVETGDTLRLQVRESAPPWLDERPVVGEQLQAETSLVTLLPGEGEPTVDTADEAAARELAGMTELLDVAVPAGWRIQWHHDATDATMDDLASALSQAVAQTDELPASSDTETTASAGAETDSAAAAAPLAAPTAGRFVWFGRASRFALDTQRREATTTMPGHHRIKAGSEAASAGVDFAEAVCAETAEIDDAAFPFTAVTDSFGPTVGDSVEINHGKPDGRCFSLGSGTVTDRDSESITVTRELSGGGSYDGLDVERSDGDTATTTFTEGRWWYPTVYRTQDEELIGTYVNICTPIECFPDAVRYVDLHVDVLKHADGTIERVDDSELAAAVDAGDIREPLAEKARSVATALEEGL